MTLNRKSEGHGHRERSQFRRSHQGLFPYKVSSLYWLMRPRTNLNAKVNQNVDRQTDGRTDRRTSSIHKPELLCNPAKNWPLLRQVVVIQRIQVQQAISFFLSYKTFFSVWVAFSTRGPRAFYRSPDNQQQTVQSDKETTRMTGFK